MSTPYTIDNEGIGGGPFLSMIINASSGTPLSGVDGAILPVPVYGGGYLRFIVASEDSARVRLHLWRVR